MCLLVLYELIFLCQKFDTMEKNSQKCINLYHTNGLTLSFPVVLPFLNLYSPHFFVCLFTSVQDDLASEDVMILDTGHEVLMAIIGSFLQFEI